MSSRMRKSPINHAVCCSPSGDHKSQCGGFACLVNPHTMPSFVPESTHLSAEQLCVKDSVIIVVLQTRTLEKQACFLIVMEPRLGRAGIPTWTPALSPRATDE
jgi:hypothetical protein